MGGLRRRPVRNCGCQEVTLVCLSFALWRMHYCYNSIKREGIKYNLIVVSLGVLGEGEGGGEMHPSYFLDYLFELRRK